MFLGTKSLKRVNLLVRTLVTIHLWAKRSDSHFPHQKYKQDHDCRSNSVKTVGFFYEKEPQVSRIALLTTNTLITDAKCAAGLVRVVALVGVLHAVAVLIFWLDLFVRLDLWLSMSCQVSLGYLLPRLKSRPCSSSDTQRPGKHAGCYLFTYFLLCKSKDTHINGWKKQMYSHSHRVHSASPLVSAFGQTLFFLWQWGQVWWKVDHNNKVCSTSIIQVQFYFWYVFSILRIVCNWWLSPNQHSLVSLPMTNPCTMENICDFNSLVMGFRNDNDILQDNRVAKVHMIHHISLMKIYLSFQKICLTP